MNDYDLLGLIDTYNAMKRDKVPNTPASLMDFLSGLSPISDDEIPQIKQGKGSYEQGIKDVEDRSKTANFVTNELRIGKDSDHPLQKFNPFPPKPNDQHGQAIKQGERLDVRRELGYDK